MAYGAYDRFAMPSSLSDAAQETAIALEAATGDKFVYTVKEPIVVFGLRIMPTVTFAYDTATALAQVSLDHRVTYGSDTGRLELVVLTLPDALAAGKFLYKDFAPKKILPGQQLVVEAKVQGAGGAGIAGDWLPHVCWAPAPETPGNCSAMVASA